MVKINKNLWKPINIDDSDGNFEGLVGIEECDDYDFNDLLSISKPPINEEKNAKKPKSKNKKKPKKRDNTETPSKNGSTIDGSFIVTEESDSKLNCASLTDLKAWDILPLPVEILEVLSELKFHEPTEIQSLTLPAAILGKRDILGAAQTGSGKTLAFGLPIICGILKLKRDILEQSQNIDEQAFYALILAPTRELAIQIKNHLQVFCKKVGLRVAVVVGGMAAEKQERVLNSGPEIVVATPGRLWELTEQGNPHLLKLSQIRYLAIDETDRMLERGHFKELESILERINTNEEMRTKRQNFVFSATLTLTHELPTHLSLKRKLKIKKHVNEMTPLQKLKKIVDRLGINNPKVVDLTNKSKGTSETLTECRITCNIEEKDYYVYYFLQKHPGRTLIFCNSIGCVKRLNTLLDLLGCQPIALHASMQQRQRLKNLDRFRERENSVMIATDVAARGLDIPSVEHVLHYQTPRTSESYVHRSGRTARASKEGITVILMEPNELSNYLRLCRTLGKSEDVPNFPVQQFYLNAVKERVNLAREVDTMNLHVKKATSENGWLEKAAEEMDIIIDNANLKRDLQEANSTKKVANIKRKQLAALLQKPIFSGMTKSWNPIDSILNKESAPSKAIDVMKSAMEKKTEKIGKSRPKVVFKSKRRLKEGCNYDIKKKDLLSEPKPKRRKFSKK